MRRIAAMLLALLLLLTGCAVQPERDAHITVSLALPEGCLAVTNGLRIESGQDAVFELKLEDGYEFASVDYGGEYSVQVEQDTLRLCLKAVRYPTLAPVKLTSRYCTITYEPNGAEGEPVSVAYDTAEHRRPNTALGTELFAREGHTLVSWNTEPDGSGTYVGLGSRADVPDGKLTLFAHWEPWLPEEQFAWEKTDTGARITAYFGTSDPVVIPGILGELPVTAIGSGAFSDCQSSHVILPSTMQTLEPGAFSRCAMRELTFFDNLEEFSDLSFRDCAWFSTVHINAVEAPYGYDYRRESCFADKMDILIQAQGKKKLVFYGGCSTWYNLDGALAQEMIGEEYQVINLGLNGVINSSAQMQIMTPFLEEGDIVFHTPELSSASQMMGRVEMINHDRKLWSGMEYNYDLVSLLDIRTLPDFFDILYYWLSTKEQTSSYEDVYRDAQGNCYVDEFGCASFCRDVTSQTLYDTVRLDPACMTQASLERLEQHYRAIREQGARVYVGHACVNLDALPQEQQALVGRMNKLFRENIGSMEGVTVVGELTDHLYHNSDFYDTNYHLLTEQARENTLVWMRELVEQMALDGLWPEKE